MPSVKPDYRRIPAIHRLLDLPALQAVVDDYGHASVMEACRAAVEQLRQRVSAGEVEGQAIATAAQALEGEILKGFAPAQPPPIRR
jgi:hypothetical protein